MRKNSARHEAPSWVDLVGYQHEVVHTGALRELLGDNEHQLYVASALIGQPVADVDRLETEKPVPPARGKVDLLGDANIAGRRARPCRVAVEMKVDSASTVEQLRDI